MLSPFLSVFVLQMTSASQSWSGSGSVPSSMNTALSQEASQMASSAALSMAHAGSDEGQPSVPAGPSGARAAAGPASKRFPSFGPGLMTEKKGTSATAASVMPAPPPPVIQAPVAEPGGEKKDPEESKQHINIKVKSQDGNEIYFKVKRVTQFRKVMLAYCRKVGADVDAVRFLFDGIRIRPEQTPEQLDMEDEDEVDALVAQTGGMM